MIGETPEGCHTPQAVIREFQDIERAADMGGFDIGDLLAAPAAERRDGGDVEPAVGAADEIRAGELHQDAAAQAVDRDRRAQRDGGADGDDFHTAVAVEIGEAGIAVLEHFRLGQAVGVDRAGGCFDDQRPGLDGVAEDGVAVSLGGAFIPGGGDIAAPTRSAVRLDQAMREAAWRGLARFRHDFARVCGGVDWRGGPPILGERAAGTH